MSIRVLYAQKMKLILCVPRMQIALVSIQRKIKFNVGPCDFAPTHFNLVPSFSGYEIAELLSFLFDCFLIFVFFWFKLKKKKNTATTTTPLQEDNFSHASGVSSYYIVLHPVSSRASRTSGILALSAITISDSILAIDVTLDRQNVHLLCILISTHLLHFMTAEIVSILRQCFDLVNYSLSSVGGLHASSSLV